MVVGAAMGKLVCAIGFANGTDVDTLVGDTVCVEVGAAMGKLVHALDVTWLRLTLDITLVNFII